MASKVPTEQLVRDRVRSLPRRIRPEAADGLAAEWELRVGPQWFAVSVHDHACSVADGPASAPAAVINTDPAAWLAIDEGRLNGGDAFFAGKLQVEGNLDLAVRLQTLFRPYRRSHKPTDLDQVEVAADGVRLSCYVVGEGPALLLLHGLGGSKVTWLSVLSSFAERHRVIVPDLPGHAESDKPVAEYSPRFYARVMRRLLDAVDVERAAVVGNSLGGRIALELALRSPARVSALALLDPSLPGFGWRYAMAFTKVFPTELGAIPFPLRARMMEVLIRRLFADPGRMPQQAFSAAAEEFIRIYRDPRARVAFLSSLRHIVTERPTTFFSTLRRIRQPTLIIFGAHDRLVAPRLGVRLAQHMPNATLVVLPDVGHVPQFEAKEETLERITAFLAAAEA
jgi:pimeloyl-ACP methyl ester carboxylesterase/putative sterol carrier protein